MKPKQSWILRVGLLVAIVVAVWGLQNYGPQSTRTRLIAVENTALAGGQSAAKGASDRFTWASNKLHGRNTDSGNLAVFDTATTTVPETPLPLPQPVKPVATPHKLVETTPKPPATTTPVTPSSPAVTGGTVPESGKVDPSSAHPPVAPKLAPPKHQNVKPSPGIVPFIGDSVGIRVINSGLSGMFKKANIGWSPLCNAAVSRGIMNAVPAHQQIVDECDPVKGYTSQLPPRRLNGYEEADAMRNGLHDAEAVVIQLGTNGDANQAGAIARMIARVQAHTPKGAKVYWVDVYDPRNEKETMRRNHLIAVAARRFGFTVIHWHALASQKKHAAWFRSDPMRLHPNNAGAKALAKLIVTTVTQKKI